MNTIPIIPTINLRFFNPRTMAFETSFAVIRSVSMWNNPVETDNIAEVFFHVIKTNHSDLLVPIPWSGMYAKGKVPIFHGDVLKNKSLVYVCHVFPNKIRFINVSNGTEVYRGQPNVDFYQVVGSALQNPVVIPHDDTRAKFDFRKFSAKQIYPPKPSPVPYKLVGESGGYKMWETGATGNPSTGEITLAPGDDGPIYVPEPKTDLFVHPDLQPSPHDPIADTPIRLPRITMMGGVPIQDAPNDPDLTPTENLEPYVTMIPGRPTRTSQEPVGGTRGAEPPIPSSDH